MARRGRALVKNKSLGHFLQHPHLSLLSSLLLLRPLFAALSSTHLGQQEATASTLQHCPPLPDWILHTTACPLSPFLLFLDNTILLPDSQTIPTIALCFHTATFPSTTGLLSTVGTGFAPPPPTCPGLPRESSLGQDSGLAHHLLQPGPLTHTYTLPTLPITYYTTRCTLA